jgi:N-acetylmuramic acid 6-phosphate etherase
LKDKQLNLSIYKFAVLPITEQDSLYPNLSELSAEEVVRAINAEDKKVAEAVERQIPQISALVEAVVKSLANGGRLFYIGAGTSGRLGNLDASECPPTYGVPHELVTGIIAGGDGAIRKAVEFAEDDIQAAFNDLKAAGIKAGDVMVGLSASGKTPYVLGGINDCKAAGIVTGCICCNSGSPIGAASDFPVEVVVGPEVITGSTRMKSGTSQKMVLNMITSAAMVKLGKVQGSKMVNMQLSNDKLIDRGTRMVMEKTGLSYNEANVALLAAGSVRKAVENHHLNHDKGQ